MDEAVKNLTDLLNDGVISIETFSKSIRALRKREQEQIPAPRTKRDVPVPTPRTKRDVPVPVPAPRRLAPRFDSRTVSIPKPVRVVATPSKPVRVVAPLTFFQTPWVIGNFLRGWQMNIPVEHPLEADPRAFLEGVRPQIRSKLEEELQALRSLKF